MNSVVYDGLPESQYSTLISLVFLLILFFCNRSALSCPLSLSENSFSLLFLLIRTICHIASSNTFTTWAVTSHYSQSFSRASTPDSCIQYWLVFWCRMSI